MHEPYAKLGAALMISHALQIVANEMDHHLHTMYGAASGEVLLGSPAQGLGTDPGNIARDRIIITQVNLREEKTLKNQPNYVRDDVRLTAIYQNPPVFINLLVLFSATHTNYTNALSAVSRVVRFFQHQRVFTQDNVLPGSLLAAHINVLDRLESFKLIFDLYSPTFEENSYMWGVIGGRQFPSCVYYLRMLDLRFSAVQGESGLITEVQQEFFQYQKAVN